VKLWYNRYTPALYDALISSGDNALLNITNFVDCTVEKEIQNAIVFTTPYKNRIIIRIYLSQSVAFEYEFWINEGWGTTANNMILFNHIDSTNVITKIFSHWNRRYHSGNHNYVTEAKGVDGERRRRRHDRPRACGCADSCRCLG